jgi:hypothetical protein
MLEFFDTLTLLLTAAAFMPESSIPSLAEAE